MKTDSERTTSFIDSMNNDEKLRLLARLCYELTVAGRGSYETQSPEVINPKLLRSINELQHRVSSQLMRMISDKTYTFPTKYFVNSFLRPDHSDDGEVEIRQAFIHSLTAFVEEVNLRKKIAREDP